MRIFLLLTLTAVTSCTQTFPNVAVDEECMETPESRRYRAEWVQRCLLSTASHYKTAPQLEQQEDIIDECADASEQFIVKSCTKQILKFKGYDGWIPCTSANPGSTSERACQNFRESMKAQGVTAL